MAIDLCSDSSTFNMSPRYSFSHDLSSKPDNNNIILPIDHHDLRRPSFDSLSNLDFDFNVRETTLHQDSSSADELFSDGMIRSVQIKKDVIICANNSSASSTKQKEQRHKRNNVKKTYIPPPPMPPPHTFHDHHDDHDLKTTLESSENQKQNSSKPSSSSSSFWRFKRSSSLNCGTGSGGYASSLCPLPLLSRSNSAGSASIDSSSSSTKTKNHQKPPSSLKNSTSSSFGHIKSNNGQGSSSNYQKPPLKKGVYGSYGSNNTLLNVPSASIFGFGSIFSNGKVKNNKAVRTHI